jgi:hypothetical protein
MSSYLEMALRVAASERPLTERDTPRPIQVRITSPTSASRPEAHGTKPLAPCGSLRCAGCYEVASGIRIHPPACGEDYRAWLERWEAKGRLQ